MPGPRIICVDRTHDGRAPFAQAYLELLRAWLAATTSSRTWLFKDVNSCGLLLSSPFSLSHAKLFPHSGKCLLPTSQSRSNGSLSAFNAQGTHDGAEKRQIMAKVGNRKIRGLEKADFKKDFMLCFDRESYDLLKNLRKADGHGDVEVHLVDMRPDIHNHEQEMQAGKVVLRKWASKLLRWQEPGVEMKKGFWGVKQVTVPEAAVVALMRERERRLVAIKKATGCDFHFEWERGDGMRVISIVGSRYQLDEAATKVLNTW